MRLFVALHLPDLVRDPVAAIQHRLRDADRRDQVRWSDVSGVHLTLQFLGEVSEDRADELVATLAGVAPGHAPPRLALDRVGGFPNLRRPRVVWVGLVEDGSALAPLHAAVGAALAPLGWPPEGRAFQPHLTVGRTRDPRGDALAPPLHAALTAPVGRSAFVGLSHLALVQSHLSPRGARYEDVAVWDLAVRR